MNFSAPTHWKGQGVAVALALILAGGSVQADPVATNALVEDLLRKLEDRDRKLEERDRKLSERDAVIADLLRRMEGLERAIAERSDQTAPRAVGAPAAVADDVARRPAHRPVSPERLVGSGQAGAGDPAYGTVDGTAPMIAEAHPSRRVSETERDTPPKRSDDAHRPGALEVDEDAAERALERTLVEEGALLLPFGKFEISPHFSYSQETTTAVLFSNQVVFLNGERPVVGEQELRQDLITGGVSFRFGLPWDSQFELAVPVRHRSLETVSTRVIGSSVDISRTRDSNVFGFGDLSLGAAKTLFREQGWRPDVIARVTWDSNLGQEHNDISVGSGFNELTASLTALKRQDPLAFVGRFAYTKPFEKDGFSPGDEFTVSLGANLGLSPDTALSINLNQTFSTEDEVNSTSIPGSADARTTLSFGVSSILGRDVLLSLNAGFGLTDIGTDYFVTAAMPVRFNLPID